MRIDTPADACAALAVLIAGADELGTIEERDFLFETVAALPMFADLNETEFSNLIAQASDGVWSLATDGTKVTEKGVSDLLGLIRGALPSELRAEAFQAAVGLAEADGVSGEEQLLLERVRAELEI